MKKLLLFFVLLCVAGAVYAQTADTLRSSVLAHKVDSAYVPALNVSRNIVFGSLTGIVRAISGVLSVTASDTAGLGTSLFGKLDKSKFIDSLNAHPDTTGLNAAIFAKLDKVHFADSLTAHGGAGSTARTVPAYTGSTTNFLRADSSWQAVSAGSANWGSINGTVSSQTDLQDSLNLKAYTTQLTTDSSTASHIPYKDALGNMIDLTVGTGLNLAAGGTLTAAGIADSMKALFLHPADSTAERTYSNALYESKTQMGTDTSSIRTNSNALYESKAQMGTDTSSIRTNSNALYESKTQMGTDTASNRTYSNSIYQTQANTTREKVYYMNDTLPLFVFGAGIGQAGDTVAFASTSYNLGAFYNKGTDTIVVTSLYSVMGHGTGTDTLNVDIMWHATMGSGSATHLITNGQPVNSITTGNEMTSFTNARIPPSVWVWCYPSASVAGRRPIFLRTTLSGYRSKP